MVTTHKSVISVYCHSSKKFYTADDFSNTIKIFPSHCDKRKSPKKRLQTPLYQCNFKAHKIVPNSLVKSVVSVKLFKN